jgi:uncharacterized membrane protein
MAAKPPVKTPDTKEQPTLKGLITDSRLLPMLNYGLVFIMVMTMGLSGVVALVIATFAQDGAADWLKGHYEFQKRTFWIGIVPVIFTYAVWAYLAKHGLTQPLFKNAATLLMFVCLLFTGGRAVMGFNHLFYNRPYPNPKSWII